MLSKFLELNEKNRIAVGVYGDSMVDEVHSVSVTRISPECPIPILKKKSRLPDLILPGGSGNVCCQLQHFNTQVYLFSMLCSYGHQVYKNIHHDYSFYLGQGFIPVKSRYYDIASDYQVERIDAEDDNFGFPNIENARNRLFGSLLNNLSKLDVVILSDYNKGVFDITDLSNISRPTIVDPKKGPLNKWIKPTIIKPNAKEAYELTGLTHWKDQAKCIADTTGALSVVITQGGDGVVGLIGDRYFDYKSTKKVFASSVVGAGDCFISIFSLCVAHGLLLEEAAEIAFEAGSVYVQKRHNTPITPFELMQGIDPIEAKLVTPEFLKNRDFKLTFTNGCFDILHEGHLKLLKDSKNLGNKLAVALNSDDSIKRLKGDKRPINSLESRKKIMASLEHVDFVVSFNEDTPKEIIDIIVPEDITKGGDYIKENIVGYDLVGPEHMHVFDLVEGKSTTKIVEKLYG